ncbi:MAG TPA: ABC transporter permease [Planctomycetota bacterium]|nr:ABC transporter permease [Planctomycetota bacterium]
MTARLREHLRTVAAAGRLGFAMESNWAPWWGYALYSLVRPVAMSLIIVAMYLVTGARDPAQLTYMFVGNAFFIFVGNVLFGIGQVVIEDREHYQMLKYIYTAPISIYAFLLGRGLTKTVMAAIAVAVTLAFGFAALPIRSGRAAVDWPLLAAAMALGLAALVFVGILLAGFTLNMARHAGFLSEGVAGVLFLFSGAAFRPNVLPGPLFRLAQASPLTYWIELSRRALVGPPPFATGLEGWSDGAILALLAASTAAAGVASVLGYRALEARARDRGKLDQRTDY